jgi:nitrite reductase/ring-hydroxylating ferredoxin subunit/uncharacterized membrane protein
MQRLAKAIENDERFDKVAEGISGRMNTALGKLPNRDAVEDVLHGKWLGHPLHPVLTDIPIGAWSFAAVLDLADVISGKRTKRPSGAIAFGMLAAVPTAISGAVDWRQTGGRARRVGVAHALLNNAALGLFALSLALRPRRAGLARLASTAGLGLVGVSGYLGGHLISELHVGIKHEAEPAGEASAFTAASLDGNLPEDTPRKIEMDGTPIVVVRHAGRVFGLSDVCPHLGCSLSEGTISGDAIVCPCHGSTFDLETGQVVRGPSTFPVRAYTPIRPAPQISTSPIEPGIE